RIAIPTPHFVVLYNGIEKRPAIEVQKLSDSFAKHVADPEIELNCTIININPTYNEELFNKCPVLKEYTEFVEQVRSNVASGMSGEEALKAAIDLCIKNNILRDFLKRRRNEVTKEIMIDMTWEVQEKLIREEGGYIKLIDQVCRKIQRGKTAAEIAEDLDEDPAEINKIYSVALKHAPDFDVQKIYDEI
ncbi:MAG: hypothetical protein K6A38_09645, partial [Lachnospiraceae bacterium]|nr:hypothetical protein [Lachnospiraceae bacterium]